MMKEFVSLMGYRIKLTHILDAANKRITDLPTIPDFVANGRPFVCWAHILGRCTFDGCKFKNGHVPRSAIPDAFAEEVVTILTPGVNAVVARAREQGGGELRKNARAWRGNSPDRRLGGRARQ